MEHSLKTGFLFSMLLFRLFMHALESRLIDKILETEPYPIMVAHLHSQYIITLYEPYHRMIPGEGDLFPFHINRVKINQIYGLEIL